MKPERQIADDVLYVILALIVSIGIGIIFLKAVT